MDKDLLKESLNLQERLNRFFVSIDDDTEEQVDTSPVFDPLLYLNGCIPKDPVMMCERRKINCKCVVDCLCDNDQFFTGSNMIVSEGSNCMYMIEIFFEDVILKKHRSGWPVWRFFVIDDDDDEFPILDIVRKNSRFYVIFQKQPMTRYKIYPDDIKVTDKNIWFRFNFMDYRHD
jgi:hypothetical protein